jgi:glucose/arabinose dehydrogenase
MRARRTLALAGALALACAACSDDEDAGSAGTPGSSGAPVASADTAATAAPTSGPPTSAAEAPVPASTPPSASPATSPTTTAAPMTGVEPVVTPAEIGTFDAPVDLAWRAGDEALYVVEQGGTIQRVVGDAATTVLDISDRTDANGEQGLLGLAFAPAGDLAYVNYTDLEGDTTIAEHPVDADGMFGADARIVLTVDQPYANHNGGDLTFGPDGLLYIGMGDGGAGGDPERRATNMAELLGKLLRIDPAASGDAQYTVPPDNPFAGQADVAPEIWASGLRNPWRFSFDRATGDLWIADVGQNAFEEIDVAPATNGLDGGKGESFGWSALEGNAPFNDDVAIEDPVPPFFTYENPAVGCSISGGVRARGGPVPDLVGWYVYGDFCAGTIWAIEVLGSGFEMTPGRQVVLGELPAITAVVDGPEGEVYVLSQQGPVVRLDPAS